jgi:uncharacterized protein YcfL
MKKWFITICAALLLVSLLVSFASVTLVGCGSDNNTVIISSTPTFTPSPATPTPSATSTPSGGTINVTVQ